MCYGTSFFILSTQTIRGGLRRKRQIEWATCFMSIIKRESRRYCSKNSFSSFCGRVFERNVKKLIKNVNCENPSLHLSRGYVWTYTPMVVVLLPWSCRKTKMSGGHSFSSPWITCVSVGAESSSSDRVSPNEWVSKQVIHRERVRERRVTQFQ